MAARPAAIDIVTQDEIPPLRGVQHSGKPCDWADKPVRGSEEFPRTGAIQRGARFQPPIWGNKLLVLFDGQDGLLRRFFSGVVLECGRIICWKISIASR